MSRKAIFLSGAGSYDPGNLLYSQDIDEVGSITYVGKSKQNGTWQLTKMVDSSGDLAITYASINNNATKTTYLSAWTDRLTLTYSDIAET